MFTDRVDENSNGFIKSFQVKERTLSIVVTLRRVLVVSLYPSSKTIEDHTCPVEGGWLESQE